jgi:sugar phosphate isomerase/epimerase
VHGTGEPRFRGVPAVLGCSTISFRNRPLAQALDLIDSLGFRVVDIGALPGVCDHVPFPLAQADVEDLVEVISRRDVQVRSINADIGALNDPRLDDRQIDRSLEPVLDLAASLGAALVLPCGGQGTRPYQDDAADLERTAANLRHCAARGARSGVDIWVEAPHARRLCHSTSLAGRLADLLPGDEIGMVLDASHVVAGGGDVDSALDLLAGRIVHVHLRDAVPGSFNLSIGRGIVPFDRLIMRLADSGYSGGYMLELETHDVAEEDRTAATARARDAIVKILSEAGTPKTPDLAQIPHSPLQTN